ncbi:MAG TPA: DUF4288 domain-containing protein [Blastocatellia bacterium]|nr:DUF4288 domain-containing protein [Blastocatellia bacterium]
MKKEPWYAARCVFQHLATERGPRQLYEERIVLLKAQSFDEAIQRAEKEAADYCRELEGCIYTDYVDVFHLFEAKIGDGTEIYSIMRRSDLQPEEYLDQYYPDEPADCEALGETHRWHNADDERSACYHCQVVRD